MKPEIRLGIVFRQVNPPILATRGFLKLISFVVAQDLSMMTAKINSGATMPKTYAMVNTAPSKYDPGRADRASTPASTGAQHVVAIPENPPSPKTEPASFFFNSG